MALYKTDMLDFRYEATLHIEHPEVDPSAITTQLGLAPKRAHQKGDPCSTPKGKPLPGQYPSHYWTCELETVDQQTISEFLRRLITAFAPHRQFLAQLAGSGGEVCIFLGIFSRHCCANQFDNRLLRDLADSGFDLRLDLYGSELPH